MIKVQDVLPGMIYIQPIDGSDFGEWLEVRKTRRLPDGRITLHFDNGLALTWTTDSVLDVFDPDDWIAE